MGDQGQEQAPGYMGSEGSAGEVDAYIAQYYAFHPHQGIWDGLHEHDGRVPDLGAAAIRGRIAELERWGARLPPTPADGPLATRSARDLALVDYARRQELFRWREWRPHERLAAFYQGPLDVSIYLKRPYAPAEARVEALARHLAAVPELLRTARETLCPPLPRLLTEQAMRGYRAIADYYERPLRAAVRQLMGDRRPPGTFGPALGAALLALRELIAFLREALGAASEEFRLGPAALAAIIRHTELVDLPLDELRRLAEDDLAHNRARAEEVAGGLGLSIADAFAAMGREPVPEERVLATVAAAVGDVRGFLAGGHLVDVALAEGADCRVVETPPYMRAGSAFMDAPGPFEPPGLPAYLYVTLPEPDWPPQLRADWLAKLNPWSLRNTAAHEAYPGHLLHFLHLARIPSAAARAFVSYACVEGWAHYAEQLVIEAGYAAADPRVELAQVGMAQLRDCRMLVALGLHAGAMSLDEAAELLARHTHLPPVRCRQEAQRGAQEPGYLAYALGKIMLLRLRDEYRRQEGEDDHPRRFHEAFLACGAPPLPLARRMLLRAPGGATGDATA
jgi:hypothetical protein